ncbi:MAG: hypothetical protein AUJ98_01535 [Bacteroidetes bacterium CG2_30_33_31]|nr:MAG: hypothetical protein AUJ98_01535 [Bacteroidetes bacterium CG2_30_33_31]
MPGAKKNSLEKFLSSIKFSVTQASIKTISLCCKIIVHLPNSDTMFKRIYFSTLFILLSVTYAIGQTLVFHENFEPPSYADSMAASPTSTWGLTHVLAATGSWADSCKVKYQDTTYLTTNSFSTSSMLFVLLEFDQICKIEFFDAATIEVSSNNGISWTKLTSSYYLGAGQFANIGNKFNATSYSIWSPSNNNIIPTNAWWKHETFDISSLVANSSQVKIRFALSDVNSSGNAGAYGWLLDNIKISAALDELIPPVISYQPPFLQDSVFSYGPFSVVANISDNSGIDSALLIYSRNGGANDTVNMLHNFGNVFTGLIDTFPTFTLHDTICYHVWAMDSSLVHNTSVNPTSNCKQFIIYNPQPYPGCNYPVVNFPYIENFDQNFTAGSGYPGSPGTLDSMWTRNPAASSTAYMWLVYSGPVSTSGTGPSADHTTGNGNYLYTESSYGSSANSTELLSPCLDLNVINVPVLEFYYNMFGSSMGELHVDIWYGNSWLNDILTPIIGNQGTAWHKASVNLNQYKGITKIRFRAIKGSSIFSDIAIDDVKIWEPPSYDAGTLSIDLPASPANTGYQPVKVTFGNFGSKSLSKITLNWQVNGNIKTPFVWTGSLSPGSIADSITIGNHTFISGPSNIKVWTSAPNDSVDGFNQNDTVQTSIIACTSPLHGSFTIGGATADFMNLGAAVYAIENCGIDSAIVFYVNAGTYIEQLDIDTIPGASMQNTITFESANGDSTGVILNFSPNNYQSPHVVRFIGASHLNFKNMTISASGTSYGRLFVFENNASYNNIENCILKMPQGAYYYTNAGYSASTKSEYNSFINNDISNGYYSFYFYGNGSTQPSKGNRFVGNHIKGYLYYGAYLMYQDSFELSRNTFINDSASTYIYPVYVYYGSGAFKIEKNNIQARGTSTIYGLMLYYCTSTASIPSKVNNNMIALTGTSTSPYGLYVYNCNYVNLYYNSVNIDVGTAVNGRALYLSSGGNIRIKNNILSNKSDGYVSYIGTTTAIIESDYNDLYASGTNFSYWGGYVNDLAGLQSVSGKEAHSVSIQPAFVSTSNLHLTTSTIGNLASPISSVLDDIDGEIRSTSSPAIGADEQPPIPIDAGILSILSPGSTAAEADSVPIIILIKNFGTYTLNSFNYSYSLNGVLQATQSYNLPLLPMAIDTVYFPKIVIVPGHNNICASTILSSDSNVYNNNLCKYFYGVPIVDMGVVSMITPDSGHCYTNTESVIIKIKNYGSKAINFALKPLTIHTNVVAPITVSIPNKVINTGTLAVGATSQITLSTTLDMNHTGDYIFNIWTTVASDGDATNDSMITKKISTFATITAFPYTQSFENFVSSSGSSDAGQLKEGWAQNNSSANYTWFVGNSSTYNMNTGPSADHTLGTASGKYCYANAGYYATTVNLVTPCINLSNMTNPTLRYWYHLFGSNIHSLRVDVYAGGQWYYSYGHVMGQQQASAAEPWKQDIVDLSSFAGQVVKLRFRAIKLIGYEADIAIDDIFIYEPVQKDAGVSNDFQLPATNFASQGVSLPIKVKIENYGLDTITDLYVSYRAGNDAPITEHWTGQIPPYSYQLHQFSTNYLVKAGEIKIKSYTSLAGDMSPINDTGSLIFTGISVMTVPYVDDFEGTNYFVNTGGLMQWQRGYPNKNKFNATHSGNNAWVTSLNDNYLNNSHDYLYTPFFNLSTFPNTFLRFWHRYDTEAGADGGNIQYTLDGGNTFILLGYISDPNATKWYNKNIGGNHFWSAQDSGWIQSTYDLSSLTGVIGPIQFRFLFYSNNSTNYSEGWMIDDFEITPNPISTDAGIIKLISPIGYTSPGSNVNISIELKNYGTSSLTQIPINYRIDNGAVVSQNWSGTLSPGASTTFSFSSAYTATAAYKLEVWTSLSGDSHWYNDSAKILMAKDVGVQAVMNPKPQMIIGDSVEVKALFGNFGNDTIYSCDLAFESNSGSPIIETWNGILPLNTNAIFTFNHKYIINYGITNFCVKTLLNGDTKASNDKKCFYISGTVGMADKAEKLFAVSQNEPNPANENSKILVTLPHNGEFIFTITDIFGKIQFSQTSKGFRGDNSIQINTSNLAQGIYFYEVSFGKLQIIKKMAVIK